MYLSLQSKSVSLFCVDNKAYGMHLKVADSLKYSGC